MLVGGGLAGCLTALRLAEEGVKSLIVEGGPEICGNHTWSFHQTDLSPADNRRIDPLIAYRWPGQKVIFPRFKRQLTTPYASVTSDRLRAAVNNTDAIAVREDCRIAELHADHVILEDGARIDSACVIDARGFAPADGLRLGYQKFVGIELELDRPHGEDIPTIMDASVDQRDGYRFFYVLPMSPTRLLIEDTRYSDGGELDAEALHSDVLAYAANRAWVVSRSIRTEKGVLPITLAQDAARFWRGFADEAAPIGLRAGLFHPTTGYSLPAAIDTANLIAGQARPLTTRRVRQAVEAFAVRRSQEQAFYRFLNRMLFNAAEPHQRYHVLQHFYRMSQPRIERLYSGKLRRADKLRVLIGRPPVPIRRALRCVREAPALDSG